MVNLTAYISWDKISRNSDSCTVLCLILDMILTWHFPSYYVFHNGSEFEVDEKKVRLSSRKIEIGLVHKLVSLYLGFLTLGTGSRGPERYPGVPEESSRTPGSKILGESTSLAIGLANCQQINATLVIFSSLLLLSHPQQIYAYCYLLHTANLSIYIFMYNFEVIDYV